jgi:membrane fusion protein, macrolide-specific efflux system
MRRKLLALVVLVALGVGAVAMSVGVLGAKPATASEYLTTPATVGDVTNDVAATGALASATTYGLVFGSSPYLATADAVAPTSDVTWPVTDLKVKPGDSVKKGQVLATAATNDVRRQLARATTDLKTANMQHTLAVGQWTDARNADDLAAERQALLQVYAAQKAVSQATEARQTLQAALRTATLTAPIDGVVSAVNVAPGFDAPAGAAIEIASSDLTVTTNVVEGDLADIKVGQSAAVTVDAVGSTIDGTVTDISPVAADSSSGVVQYPVTVALKNVPATARPGMSADVAITIASAQDVVTVPASALQGTNGDYAVMTLGADGTPRRVPVQVGLVTNASAEIKSGLDAGVPVVIGTTADLVGTTNGGFGGFGVPGGAVRRFGNGAGGNGGGGNGGGNAPQVVTNP